MTEISMSQTANINALLVSLSDRFPKMRVTVTNLGGCRIDDRGIQFFQKPTESTIELGELNRQQMLNSMREDGKKRQIKAVREHHRRKAYGSEESSS